MWRMTTSVCNRDEPVDQLRPLWRLFREAIGVNPKRITAHDEHLGSVTASNTSKQSTTTD